MMSSRLPHGGIAALIALFLVPVFAPLARAQQIDEFDRRRGKDMLNTVRKDIQANYYDPSFKGMDLEAKFKAAEELIGKAQSNSQIFAIIAQTVIDLDDSHTWFIPPSRAVKINYGFIPQMVGDQCFVAAVRPELDAAKKLVPGDRILSIAGFKPTRSSLWKISYLLYQIAPRQSLPMVVESPDGTQRQVEVIAAVKELGRMVNLTDSLEISKYIRDLEASGKAYEHRMSEVEGVAFWKMPAFDLSEQQIDRFMGKVKDKSALVLDLRGNGGGADVTLRRLIGSLFDRDVKAFDDVQRKEKKPFVAKTRGENAFRGKLVVLIDSMSGSASEILARVVQLEKRGVVIGDRSAGAVMGSRFFGHMMGANTGIFYGASVTVSDGVMADGKSLEKVGVTPDEALTPTPADIAAGRDPVLARAAELAGVKISPEKAGTMFPIIWEKW